MKTNIQKTVRTGNGFKERLHIKSFATADAAHGFLNKQFDNLWSIARPEHSDKKAGIYAFAGGQWHNVRSLDSTVLAHI
jgi:hypothetical protein